MFVALGLSLVVSGGGCGDDGGTGPGGGTPHFNTGTGFDTRVSVIMLALDGSGDVYAGGEFSQYDGMTANNIARLNRDGSLDAGFDGGTGFESDTGAPGFESAVRDIEPIADGTGDIYVGGEFVGFRGNARSRIVRVNPDGTEGSVDFGSGFDASVLSLALNEGLGDLYAGGRFAGFRQNGLDLVARVDPDGTGDPGFDTGSGFVEPFNFFSWVESIEVARDGTGRIYAGGFFNSFRGNSRSGIVRINPDGSNDGSFDPGTGFNGRVRKVAIANDGSNNLYAVGTFSVYRGNSRRGIARITPSGADDLDFVTGTGFNDNYVIRTVAMAKDGSRDIYVGGDFISYDGDPAFRIARLNRDGSLDTGFATGSGFNVRVLTIAPAADGSGDVLVGGDFTEYNGTPVGRIVRLNQDGRLD